MAVFGFHFVVTLIGATIFSKIISRISICNFILFKGLYYYLIEGSLTEQNTNIKDFKRRKKNQSIQQNDANERLLRIPLTSMALEGVPMFSTLIWSFNYFVFAIIVYTISDLFTFIFPLNEDRNTSLIWIFCAFFFLIHVLCRLTAIKLSTAELHAERNILVCFALIFFLISMVFVMFSDNFMDIEFQKGYKSLLLSLNKFLEVQGYIGVFDTNTETNFESSHLLFLISLSFLFAIIGAIFLFPNIQYSSWYFQATETSENLLIKFLIHFGFFLPLISFLMFTKPVKEHFMVNTRISNSAFEAFRILLVIIWSLIRCASSKVYLQVFLDTPKYKIYEFQQDKAKNRQKKIAYYALYFCAATLQYFAPVLITLITALLLKTFGGISFLSLLHWTSETKVPKLILDSDDIGNIALKILLSPGMQKPLWTLFLVAFLGIQSSLSIIGVVFRRIYLNQI